jgi:prevent-host-death family protein
MTTVSAAEAKQNLDALLENVQQGPVCIQREDREIAVILSADEYDKLVSNRWRAFDRLTAMAAEQARANGLTEEKLNEILADR